MCLAQGPQSFELVLDLIVISTQTHNTDCSGFIQASLSKIQGLFKDFSRQF